MYIPSSWLDHNTANTLALRPERMLELMGLAEEGEGYGVSDCTDGFNLCMRREIVEILASQKQMLIRRGENSDGDDKQMAEMFQEHLKRVHVWLANQPNMDVLYLDYNTLMANPNPEIKAVAEFLDLSDNLDAMLAIPDKKLYRQKAN